MRVQIPIAILAFFALPLLPSEAAFTDFSDFTENASFADGEVFQSGDLFFKSVQLFPTSNLTAVFVNRGNHFLGPGPGVEILLPDGTREVAISYVVGSGLGLFINGIEPPFTPGVTPRLSQLDGVSVAGVSFETVLSSQGQASEGGTFTMRGSIDSLSFFGVELFFDDVTVVVPEPTSAVMLLVAILFGAGTRRRRSV